MCDMRHGLVLLRLDVLALFIKDLFDGMFVKTRSEFTPDILEGDVFFPATDNMIVGISLS